MDHYDVVVVGGGIAGASAACVLARAGVSVLLLERSERYEDHVRGEGMPPWGVTEAARLGVDDVMVGAGGAFVTKIAAYDEAWDASTVMPTDLSVFGLRGFLHAGHPDACAALAAAAAGAGAALARGAEVRAVLPGRPPRLRYAADADEEIEVSADLVIGADGRSSFVRRQLCLELCTTEALTFGAGLLVTGDQWPEDVLGLGTEGDVHYVFAPRPGATRLYIFTTPDFAKARFSGAEKASAVIDAAQLSSLPGPLPFASAVAAGPCAVYPMTDSWLDTPTAEGVVLVGDAAGWSNPIVGQGLAVAVRDVRMVVDVVRAGEHLRPGGFADYVAERRERMRRLRLLSFVDTCVLSRFDDIGRETRVEWQTRVNEDATAAAFVFAKALGVDDFPPEVFDVDTVRELVGPEHPYMGALPSFVDAG